MTPTWVGMFGTCYALIVRFQLKGTSFHRLATHTSIMHKFIFQMQNDSGSMVIITAVLYSEYAVLFSLCSVLWM